MPRKPRIPSPGWTHGQLLGAVAMAQSNMKRIIEAPNISNKVRERAVNIHYMCTTLSTILKNRS